MTSQDKKASLSSMASSTNSSNSHGPPGKKTKSNPQANATITKRKLSALIIDDR